MTTEEKAKAYDEAFERAKNLHKDAIDMEENLLAKQCEIIFPELEESEDEKIRRTLIRICKKALPDIFKTYGYEGNKENIIAWLERQKKYSPKWEEDFEIGYQDTLWCIKQAYETTKGENDTGTCWFAEKWLNDIKEDVTLRKQKDILLKIMSK